MLVSAFKELARTISFVENEHPSSAQILSSLKINHSIPVVGITGPPGAGKSTLVNAIISKLGVENKIGIICVDPTSPFNYGAILGDRLRLSEHFNNENIFIRSLATRGSLGGLSNKIIEVLDVMRSFNFNYIFIETVGVGQSEVEIAGLADTTIVVLVPEAGDEIQTMKAGVMEIADLFIVNKSDREGAERFVKNLKALSAQQHTRQWMIPVLKTTATKKEGIDEMIKYINEHHALHLQNHRRVFLLFEKAIRLIQKKRLSDLNKENMIEALKHEIQNEAFNIYDWVKKYL
jgi:LAO/AO transport system kinase